jgi:hypothetical protein
MPPRPAGCPNEPARRRARAPGLVSSRLAPSSLLPLFAAGFSSTMPRATRRAERDVRSTRAARRALPPSRIRRTWLSTKRRSSNVSIGDAVSRAPPGRNRAARARYPGGTGRPRGGTGRLCGGTGRPCGKRGRPCGETGRPRYGEARCEAATAGGVHESPSGGRSIARAVVRSGRVVVASSPPPARQGPRPALLAGAPSAPAAVTSARRSGRSAARLVPGGA